MILREVRNFIHDVGFIQSTSKLIADWTLEYSGVVSKE